MNTEHIFIFILALWDFFGTVWVYIALTQRDEARRDLETFKRCNFLIFNDDVCKTYVRIRERSPEYRPRADETLSALVDDARAMGMYD